VGTKVSAATAGRVSYVGVAGSSGLTVGVRSSDGRFDLSYLHLSAASVHEGDQVDGGDAIGAVGTSGRRSADQPHLHFGVRDAGARQAYRNPLDFLPPIAPPAAEPQQPPVAAAAPTPVVAPPAIAPAFGAVQVAVPEVGALVPGPAAAADPSPAVAAPVAAGPSAHAAQPQGHPRRAGHADVRGGAHAGEHAPHATRVTAADLAAPAARDQHGHLDRAQSAAAHPSGGSSAAPAPGVGPGDAADAPAAKLAVAPPAPHAARPSSGGGVNVGWLAALVGLVAASLCLGRPQEAGHAVRRSRATVGALLRPLTGRS
jgi:hypothetical protein